MKHLMHLLWFVLLAGMVSAAGQLAVPSEVNFGAIGINTTGSAQFEIRNSGDQQLVNLSLSSDAPFSVTFSPANLSSLAAGASATIAVNATIPFSQVQGPRTLGNVIVTANQTDGTQISSTFALKATIIGRLILDDLDVTIDNEENKDLQNATAIPKTAKPGSTITFDVRVKNTFTTIEKTKLEDAFITVRLEGINDGEDLEKESNTFELPADRTRLETFRFTLPGLIDEDTYVVHIEAEGEDENGRIHSAELELELDIRRENHDILVQNLQIDPVKASCGESVTLSFDLLNYGQGEEESAAYTIQNPALGIVLSEGPIYLDDPETEDYSSHITRRIALPANAPAGNHNIEVRSYYDTDQLSNLGRVFLEVMCAPAAPEVQPVAEPEQPEAQPEEELFPEPGEPLEPAEPAAEEISSISPGIKVALLILANLVILTAAGLLVLKLFMMRK